MEQRVSLITLGVDDLSVAKKFYEDGLGWKAGFSEENITFYQLNGVVFALFPKVEFDKDIQFESVSGVGTVALSYNVKSKEEVDSTIEQAREAGAKILKEPQDTFWGGYSGNFVDMDSHVWEVSHNPFWKIDEQGNIWLAKDDN